MTKYPIGESTHNPNSFRKFVKTPTFMIVVLFFSCSFSGCLGDQQEVSEIPNVSNQPITIPENIDENAITMAGSSTVYPLATAWASSFMQTNSQTSVYVAGGGSSAGASRVCSTGQDHVDIGDMSRGWKAIEASRQGNTRNYTCANSDVEVTQIPIALDGITVIVKRGGAAAECIERLGGLSIAQLRWIYSDWTDEDLTYSSEADLDMASVTSNNDGDTNREWSDLSDDPACSTQSINLWGADSESGTYEYFGENVFCRKCFLREYGYAEESFDGNRGYQSSAEDNAIISALIEDEYAIAYVGYAYFAESSSELLAVPIVDHETMGATDVISEGGEAIIPTEDSIRSLNYTPLSREIYMNVDVSSWDKVRPFFQYGFSADGQLDVSSVGYVPLPENIRQEALELIN